MPAEDVALVFDPSSFERGFASIAKGMNAMAGKMGGFGKAMTFSVAKAEIAVHALGAALHAVTNAINQQMPEIGTVFGVVKDTILRNFFFPLRQQILPLLQRLLDWTRAHRAMFVQWGQVAVGLFRTLWTVGKVIVDTIRNLVDVLFPRFARAFGGNFADTINLILFKVSTVAIAVGIILRDFTQKWGGPLHSILQDIWGIVEGVAKVAWSAISGFFEGAAKQFPGLVSAFQDLFGAIKSLTDFLSSSGALNIIKEVFSWFGSAVFAGIITSIEAAVIVLRALKDTIDWIATGKANFSNLVSPLESIRAAWEKVPGVKEAEAAIGTAASRIAAGFGSGAGGTIQAPPARVLTHVGERNWSGGGSVNHHHTIAVQIHSVSSAEAAHRYGLEFGLGFARSFKDTLLNDASRGGK